MPEAMKKVRSDLGEQAILLQSKTVYTGGFLGFFKKKNIEVVAAVDPQIDRTPIKKEGQIPPAYIPQAPVLKEKHAVQADDGKLASEVSELKEMIKQLSRQTDRSLEAYPKEFHGVLLHLKTQEVSDALIHELAQTLMEKWKQEKGTADEERVRQWSRDWMQGKLQPYQPEEALFNKKYINIMGPTGVGKTTTLAKIAAMNVLEHKKKIAFITTDTYRIAAIEQLKIYANLLNVPVEVAYKAEDFRKAVDKFKEYDLIFIDTAGRNYRESSYINELEQIISFDESENYLVLSLTSKENDLEEIIENFSKVPIYRLIFTKLDETKTRGTLLNLIHKYNKGAAFITNGQNVPDDMMKADTVKITNLIFGDKYSE